MMSNGRCRALVALLFAGCHASGDVEDVVSTVRVTPSSLSSPGSWGLFDRSLESGFVPDAQVVRADLDHQEQITAIKVYGAAPYRLRLTGRDGSSVGFAATDLSKLSAGWNVIASSSLISTNAVELRFEPLGSPGTVPEIELWAVEDESIGKVDVASSDLPSGFVLLAPDTKSEDLAPTDCATFAVTSTRAPTTFRKLHLVYEAEGLFRSFSLRRSINGLAEQGGTWLAGDTSKRTFVEEIDPAVVHLGKNEIRMCLPRDATRGVSITNLHLVGELDRGKGLGSDVSVGELARSGSALLDADPATTVDLAAKESIVLGFDRLIAPDTVEVVGRGFDAAHPPNVSCNPIKGDSFSVPAKARVATGSLVIQLDAATKQCAALSLSFPDAVTLSSIDVIGSGAAEPVDWARVVVTSPLEHFGDTAWIGGFVARPAIMTGAIRVDVADGRETAMTGDFGRLITRVKDASGAWPIDVKATLPDGTTQNKTVLLDQDLHSQLANAKATPAVNAAKAAVDTRFGKEGDVVVGRARKLEAISVRLGTSVGIDVPVGAVQKDTNINIRHLGEDVLPPLDPGMINVTAPKNHGYEFLPHGQRFAKDVEVVVPYDSSLIPEDMKPDDVHTFYYDPIEQHWKQLERNAVDVGEKLLKSRTNHFTIMIDAVLAVPKNPAPLSFDPTLLTSIAAASPASGIDLINPPTPNSTGDARLALPIRAPAGRGAYTPAPVLSYNSSAGESWVGLHWDLQLSRIELDTRWGTPRYDGNDRYVFDGASMVPTTETEGPKCQDGSVGLRFHTRVEGGFAHILRCAYASADGPIYHFEVRDRDGTLFVYGDDPATPPPGGTPANASLVDPNSSTHVARWELAKVVDRHGNITRFSYLRDDIQGAEPGRELYPLQITYTASSTSALPPPYRITFELDDGSRPDQMSSGRSGFKVVTRHLLRAVHVQYQEHDVRTYVLTYVPGRFGKSVLRSIQVYGAGVCTPGRNAFQAPACSDSLRLDEHSFDYYTEPEAFADPVQIPVDGPDPTQATALNMGATSSTTGGLFAQVGLGDLSASLGGTIETGSRDEVAAMHDLSGDGLPDEIVQDATGALHVLYNEQDPVTLMPRKYTIDSERAIVGLPRIGHEGHGTWTIKGALSFGVSLTGSYSDSTSQGKARLVDIDGDGYSDYLAGTSRFGLPCPDGMCFADGDYGAPSGVDPRLDPILGAIAGDLSQRLILADPVVQWNAPRPGHVVVTGSARRLGFTSGLPVTVQVYRGDTFLTELQLSTMDTEEAPFAVGEFDVATDDTFYLRALSGGEVTSGRDSAQLVDADLHIEYVTDCSTLGCHPIPSPPPHEPTGAAIYSFDARDDFRVAGQPTFVVAPVTGKLHLRGTLHKEPTAADVRACVQVLPAVSQGTPPSFVQTCASDEEGVKNVSGTQLMASRSTATRLFDLEIDVTAGELVMLRVESDFSFDPWAIRFDRVSDQPFVAYDQVCLPSNGQELCSADAGALASVALPQRSTRDFGPYIALAKYAATPLVATADGTVAIDEISIGDQSAVFAIRSDRQGLIAQYDCKNIGGCTAIQPTPIQVTTGESISFEVVASSLVFLVPSNVTGTIAGSDFDVAVGISTGQVPLGNIGPFVGGYHSFRASLWNEAEAFAPTQLINDFEIVNFLSDERKLQMLRSAIVPVPTFGNDPVVGGVRAWRGPDSRAYVSARATNAGYVGLVADGTSGNDGGGLFQPGYSRLSGTISKSIGISSGIVKVSQIFGVSFSINAGSSDTVTTTDALDMNGDGVLDILAGKKLVLGALTSDPAGREQIPEFLAGGGFRKRHSIDYGIGFGGTAVPYTTSSGRTTIMTQQREPGVSLGFGKTVGLAVQRSATTDDVVDVNNDGLPDVVRRDGSNILVRLNFGNRLGAWETFGHVDPELQVEIDGFEHVEGLTDWIPLVGEIVETGSKALQHDTNITQNTTDSLDLILYSRASTTSLTTTRTTRQFQDLNGDGLPDLLVKRAGENFIRVQYNLGTKFSEPMHWAVPDWPSDVELSPIFTSRVSQLGLTGPDVLAGTGAQIAKSTSSTIAVPIPGTPVIVGGEWTTADSVDSYELALLDINGDATADHVLKRASGNGVTFWVRRNLAAGKANLLQTVHGPLGGSIALDYARTPNTADMPHSKFVLSRVEVDDGIDLGADFASPNLSTTIQYEHGVYQRHEKEFYGFGKVISTRADGTSTEQTYINDPARYALRGRLAIEIRRDPKQVVLQRHDTSYALLDVVDGTGQLVTPDASCTGHLHPLLTRESGACRPTFSVAVQDTDTWFEGFQSKTRTRRTLAGDFDRFGNELASTDEGDDAVTSDDVYARATYRNDTTRWILDRVTSLQVRAGGASGALLRSRRGDYNDFGDLVATHVDTGTDTATSTFGYDSFGNLNHVETPPNHRTQHQTFDVIYDAEAATYPVSTTNGFGETSTAQYDLRFGIATRETAMNGESLTRTLDEFGRLVAVGGPYDISGPGLEMTYVLNEPKKRAVTVTHPAPPPGYTATLAPLTAVTVIDGFGRTIEQRKTAFVGGTLGMTSSGLVKRDKVDRVLSAYQPFFTPTVGSNFEPPSVTPRSTAMLYDAHDRPLVVTYPDGAHDTTEYTLGSAPLPGALLLLVTKTIAANGNRRESYTDMLGRVRAFVEHPTTETQISVDAVSQYDYQATGELVRIVDAEGNVTRLGYDLRGLRTSLESQDTGLIEQRFDAMGNRVALIEPNHRILGVEVGYTFDRDRLIGVDYPSKHDVVMTYGTSGLATGRLVRVEDESGSQVHTYGKQGELVRTVRTVPPAQGNQPLVFDTQFTSDSLGRQLAVRYPDGVTVKSTYDSAGILARVEGFGAGWSKTYASQLTYDVFGNRIHMRSGNGVDTNWTFDPDRIRLKTVDTTLPGTSARPIQALRYEYDLSGNPKQIRNELLALSGGDGTLPGTSTVTFKYDGVDRLLQAEGSAQLSAQKQTTYVQTQAYSASHNLVAKSRTHLISQPSLIPTAPASTNFASDYTYESGRPHLPSKIGDLLVTYDASGNPLTRRNVSNNALQALVWDDDGRLVDYQGGGVHQQNTYDATGLRVRRKSTQSETVFANMYFDLENGTQGVRHVFAGSTRVVSELIKFSGGQNPSAPDKPGTAYFFHGDHLGSTTVVTNDAGAVHESIEYFPDGEAWIDRGPLKPVNRYMFSGKPFDPDTGFYDFGQRFYDPRTSLWLSTDPAVTSEPNKAIASPSRANVSAFAGGNPLTNVDADGRDFFWVHGHTVEFTHEPNIGGKYGEPYFTGIYSGVEGAQRAQAASTWLAARKPTDGAVAETGPEILIPGARVGGLIVKAPKVAWGIFVGVVLPLVAGGLAKDPHEAGCMAACAVGTASPKRPSLRQAPSLVPQLAEDVGPTTRVVTSLTDAPNATKGLSVSFGEDAETLARVSRKGGTLYEGQVPKKLLTELQDKGQVWESTTEEVGTGVRAKELRFTPEGAAKVIPYLKPIKPVE